jgi:hypothetical protein|nr:MAG TPA: hypothetical protein [Caudoviricetes sp.]
MSTIRIYSKAAFAFGPGAQQGTDVIDSFVTVPGSFQDMPEKYTQDPTFKRAVQFHEVEIIEKKTFVQVNKAENEATVEDGNKDDTVVDPVEKFYEELKGMNKEQTAEIAKKYGAEFIEGDALKMNKKRVMEAYKLSITEE